MSFLKVVRGRMPPLRAKLVGQVFKRIDHMARSGGKGQGDGVLTADDLAHAFSGKEHPEVKAGKKPESVVLQEMLQQFEGNKGNRDGQITLEEWMAYYEELSASIETDDHFDQMITGAWAPLFDRNQAGKDALPPPVSTTEIDALEKKLIEAIRARSSGSSETQALEKVFKQFDTNKSGTIDLVEFCTAMERFGMATSNDGVSGCTPRLMAALFERYDTDGMGSLSYAEFVRGIFKLDVVPPRFAQKPKSPQKTDDTSLPLPSERNAYPPQLGVSHARGRSGVTNGAMHNAPPPPLGGAPGFGQCGTTAAAGMRSAVPGPAMQATQPNAAAGMRSQVAGSSFMKSSGLIGRHM